MAFELANYVLEDWPNESITYIKFLDDNDPSLIFIMTYCKSINTTYMKVMKI